MKVITKPGSPSTNGFNMHKDLRALSSALQLTSDLNEPFVVQLLQHLPSAIYTCDENGVITFYNEAAAALWGTSPVIGQDLWCGSWKIYSVDGSPLPLDQCPMAVTLKEGRAIEGAEIIVERPDGKKLFVAPHPRPLFSSSGKLVGAVNLLVDITPYKIAAVQIKESEQLRKKNEELRRSEERYHRMVAEVQDYAIILLSKEGIIENWNKGAEKIKGYSADEIVGKHFNIFYTEQDRLSGLPEKLLELARTEGKSNHEGWRVRKDGSTFWGNIVLTSLHDENNNIIGFSKVTRDLSAQRNAELELQEKNKELEAMNQELASFAYVSSHDLQEPLRKIQTFASRILETENDKLSDRGKDYFQRMQNAALRMQNLIEDLLAYSRTNTTEKNFETTDLNLLLNEVKTDLSETIENKSATIHAVDLPSLEVVPFQVNQLFSNVLANALKFSQPDTAPVIEITYNIVSGKVLKDAPAVAAKNYHHIAIKDNGIGFEPEHSTRIFEVFQRLHGRSEYSGTGIGLAICKKIMDNHGGFITADSQLDQGATFHLYFPVKA